MSNVVAAAQVKGSKTLEKNLVVVLKYRNGSRVVSQESCWQVRGFLFWLVTPAFATEPCQRKLNPALTQHSCFWDPCTSVSLTSPVTSSQGIFWDGLCGSQLVELICTALSQLRSISELLQLPAVALLQFCCGLRVRKGL